MNEKLTSRYASISLSGDLIEKERQVKSQWMEEEKEGKKVI